MKFLTIRKLLLFRIKRLCRCSEMTSRAGEATWLWCPILGPPMTRQRHFSDKWYLTIIAVTLALNSAAGQQFEGTVTANGEQPLVGALVKAEAKGGIQTVVTKTDSNGYFALSDLKTDPILLSIELDGKLLFRAIVPSRPQSPLNISLPTPIRKTGSWVPVDLASGTGSTVFVLDRDNAVSKITVDSRGSRLESVFVLPQSHALSAIAASQQSVLVTGNNGADCSIFRYSIETKSLSSKTISGQGSCAGIATDGNVLYVVFTDRKEIKFWKSWDSGSYGLWRFDDMRTPRSEEHTSELQSRQYLVCRLLLEKKK